MASRNSRSIWRWSPALAALALCACSRSEDRHPPADGTHAYRPSDYPASPATEQALVTACFARDALEDQSVEAAAGGALEGLISLAQGKPADRGIIFAPGFRTEPTVDYDVTIPLSLDDVLSTLHSAIKVDYRRRGGSNQDGYAFRYVTRERLLDSCGSAMHVCTYEVYQCREFNARMQFDGPLQAFRLVAIGRGRMDRATILHSIENAGSQEAQSRRITQSRERKPDGGTGSPATVPHAVK